MSSENLDLTTQVGEVKSYSGDEIKNYFENKFKEIKSQEPAGVKLVDKDADGNSKYVFDEDADNSIYKDKQLIETARAYYYERDGLNFKTDKGVVDKFISDRTWKQANTYSIGKELIYATSESVSLEQKRRLAYLTDYWSALPNFYEAGGRGYVDGLVSNITKGIVDPTNLLGPIVAKLTIGTAVTQAGKKGVDLATKSVLKKAVLYGTGAQFATDGVVGASVDAAIQSTEKELQLRNTYDPKRMFTSAIIQGGVGILPGLPYTYGAAKTKINQAQIKKFLDDNTQAIFDYAHPLKDLNNRLYGVKADIEGYKVKGKEIDKLLKDYVGDNPNNALSKKINKYFELDNDDLSAGAGLALSKKEVRLLSGKGKDIDYLSYRDPGDHGYLLLRELAATFAKAESAIVETGKVTLPVTVSRNSLGKDTGIILKGGMEAADSKPLLKIYESIADAKLVPEFNNYIQARRSQILNDRGITTSMTKPQIKQAIDNYKKLNTNQKPLFDEGLVELKKFSDAMLELHRRVGIISDAEYKLILKANPIYAPFYTKTLDATIRDLEQLAKVKDIRSPSTVLAKTPTPTKGGVKGPGKFEITGNDKDILPLHEAFMKHTFYAYQAAERNLAKLRVYDEIDEAVGRGIFKEGEVVKPISKVEFTKVLKKPLLKALEEEAATRGIKFSKRLSSELFEGEDAIKVMSLKNNFLTNDKRVIDLVYKNGKLKAYEIIKPEYVDMFKSMGGVTSTYMNKFGEFLNKLIRGGKFKGQDKTGKAAIALREVSRVFPNLITHSPPFIAFNGIRDTLSGSVNSAFGFNALGFFPGLDTAIGLGKGFNAGKVIAKELAGTLNPKDPNFLKLIRGFKNAFQVSDYYRRMLNAGGGFSGRRDTERLLSNLNRKIKNADIPAKDKTAYQKSINGLKEIFYFGGDLVKGYGQLVNRVEYASRLGEFNLAKKAGMSDRVASFGSREISTDFGMHGSSVGLNAYNRVTMFFQAGLNGFYRGVLRRPFENPGKFAAGVAATVVVPELIFWTLANETPEYQELSEDIKLLHYTIPVYMEDQPDGSHLRTMPDGSTQRKIKHFLLIPKPYDLGAFANIARGIVEGVQEGNPALIVQYFFASIAKVFPGLVKPTLLSPVIDLYMNKNYKDNQIIPYYKSKGLFRDSMVNSNTRPTAIKLAGFINEMYNAADSSVFSDTGVSPLTIDYLINNYFVGLAQFAPDIADAKFSWDEKAYGPMPEKRVDENDIINNIFSIITRRFISKATPTKFSENVSLIYTLKAKAQKITLDKNNASNNLIEIARNSGIDVDKIADERVLDAERALPLLTDAIKTIQELRELRESVKFKKFDSNGIELTAEKKLELMEKYKAQENQLAFNVLKDIKEFKDPTFFVNYFGTKTYKEYNKKNIKTRSIQKVFGDIQTKIFN
tara:strand:+ start:674 stop:4912 length:4239 start_codon:yes stop_codon:yes gene_type:complete